jgi:hypothetical protein
MAPPDRQSQEGAGSNVDGLGSLQDQANADMFDEDFGKMKMELFRERCRNILGGPARPLGGGLNQDDDPDYDDIESFNDIAYEGEVVDIVTAYKSLKLVMSKNVKGVAEGREQVTGKGYLKPTMASR